MYWIFGIRYTENQKYVEKWLFLTNNLRSYKLKINKQNILNPKKKILLAIANFTKPNRTLEIQ